MCVLLAWQSIPKEHPQKTGNGVIFFFYQLYSFLTLPFPLAWKFICSRMQSKLSDIKISSRVSFRGPCNAARGAMSYMSQKFEKHLGSLSAGYLRASSYPSVTCAFYLSSCPGCTACFKLNSSSPFLGSHLLPPPSTPTASKIRGPRTTRT